MSSFTRTIQRTGKRKDNVDCLAPHFMGRGTNLGVHNPKAADLLSRMGQRKPPKPKKVWKPKVRRDLTPQRPYGTKPARISAHEGKMMVKDSRRAGYRPKQVVSGAELKLNARTGRAHANEREKARRVRQGRVTK